MKHKLFIILIFLSISWGNNMAEWKLEWQGKFGCYNFAQGQFVPPEDIGGKNFLKLIGNGATTQVTSPTAVSDRIGFYKSNDIVIPNHPSITVTNLCHETSTGKLALITANGFLGGPAQIQWMNEKGLKFSWWSMDIPQNEKNAYLMNFKKYYPTDIWLPFARSPTFTQEFFFGGDTRISYPIITLLEAYRKAVGDLNIQFRQLGTVFYTHEVMYAILISPVSYTQRFSLDTFPLLPLNPPCQGVNIMPPGITLNASTKLVQTPGQTVQMILNEPWKWTPFSTSNTYTEKKVYPESGWTFYQRLWDNFCFAFLLPDGTSMKPNIPY